MKKLLRYGLLVVVIGLLGYKSVYVKKLSEVKNTANAKFNAAEFAKKLWAEKMPAKMDSAVVLPDLISAIQQDKASALKNHSNALAIGNYRYALIKATGKITTINADEMQIEIPVADSVIKATIVTEYIYGNAIRDASGLVELKDFSNTTDLNSVSEELNKIVRTSVLPDFKTNAKAGDTVNLTAAVQINQEHIKWQGIELLPVRIQLVK